MKYIPYLVNIKFHRFPVLLEKSLGSKCCISLTNQETLSYVAEFPCLILHYVKQQEQ